MSRLAEMRDRLSKGNVRLRYPDMNKPKTVRISLLAAVLVVAGIGFFVARPAHNQIGVLRAQVAQQRQKSASLQASLPGLRQQLAQAKRDHGHPHRPSKSGHSLAQALAIAFPHTVAFDRELTRLYRLAKVTNVNLTSYQPQAAVASGSFTSFPVTMAVSGSFGDCLRFLGGLQHMVTITSGPVVHSVGPIWSVRGLTINTAGKGNVQMTLTAAVYAAPSAAGAGTTAPTNQNAAGSATPAPTTQPQGAQGQAPPSTSPTNAGGSQ